MQIPQPSPSSHKDYRKRLLNSMAGPEKKQKPDTTTTPNKLPTIRVKPPAPPQSHSSSSAPLLETPPSGPSSTGVYPHIPTQSNTEAHRGVRRNPGKQKQSTTQQTVQLDPDALKKAAARYKA